MLAFFLKGITLLLNAQNRRSNRFSENRESSVGERRPKRDGEGSLGAATLKL